MCCREALHCSFEVASDNLHRTAQLSISGGTVREMVENQGRAVIAAQRNGSFPSAFTAAECTAQTLITGTDGVMVPMVTERQKQKRRATESAQRIEQGRSSTAAVGRPKQGSDGPCKEFKLVAFYDPDKSHCHVVGTSGDCEAAGGLMRREARRLHLAQAKVKYAVSDGAEWIAHQYRRQLPMLDEHILDYYHLWEHVVRTSHVLYSSRRPEQSGYGKLRILRPQMTFLACRTSFSGQSNENKDDGPHILGGSCGAIGGVLGSTPRQKKSP